MKDVPSVTHETAASPEDVATVLSNGWLYPTWVVGAARMRKVDPTWPAPGSRLHHSFGPWPFLIDDTTEVLDAALPERLVMSARGWPVGVARVEIRIHRTASGSVIEIEEDASTGPAKLVPRPVRQVLMTWRNTETLRRLAFIAESHAAHSAADR